MTSWLSRQASISCSAGWQEGLQAANTSGTLVQAWKANNQGKVAAAPIVAQLSGWAPNPAPMLTNTCYSFVDDRKVVHVASVHSYVPAEQTFKTVAGSGGLSSEPTELEGVYAKNWARNIWADMLT